ncbi:MAG: glycosyltransferase family 4 protein [Spirochaetaceae bacterium]
MKIGLVVYGALDRRSGGFLYDRRLVDGLRGRGHSVTVYGQAEGPYLTQLRRGHFPDRRVIEGSRDLDVLIEDELNHPSLLGTNRAIRALRRRGIRSPKIVAVVHHLRSSERLSLPGRLLARLAERRFLRGVDAAVYNSRTTESSVLRLLGGPSTGAELPGLVAPPGVSALPCGPPEESTPAGQNPAVGSAPAGQNPAAGSTPAGQNPAAGSTPAARGAPAANAIYTGGEEAPRLRLLFVGNIIPRKGLLPLLRAIETLRPGERRSVALTIAGGLDANPGYRRRVERAIRRIGAECTVRLLGRVDDYTLCRLYLSHDVLAAPSFYEGYGMVYAEAQRYGLAVLAGRGGAGPEVIDDGTTGLLVDPGKPDTIRRALRRLLEEPALGARMGQAGRRGPHWRWEDTVAAVEAFLLEQR